MAQYFFSPLLRYPTSGELHHTDRFQYDVGYTMPNRNQNVTIVGCTGSLANVAATDELFVYAHGDYRTKKLYTKVGSQEFISPNQLADILKARGLHDHAGLVVNLFACTSGVVGEDGRSMAHLLALNLHRCGYRQLKVRGYVGFVQVNDGLDLQVAKRFGGDLQQAQGVASNNKSANARGVVYNLNGTINSGHEGRGIETRRGNETHFRIRNL